MLLFLPVFIIGFCILRRTLFGKTSKELVLYLWIILGSLVFYGLFGLRNFLVLLFSLFWNGITSYALSRADAGQKSSLYKKAVLFSGIFADVLLLLAFKFTGRVLPIAISFYTFNQISFIVDIYRGDVEGEDFDVIRYLGYILFFPKLLQGPLMQYKKFETGMKRAFESRVDYEVVMRGLLLLSIGLFKKVILADTFGIAVNYGFSNIAVLGRMEAILSAFFYSFQLYFDFSGYCDVASAVCMLMGFELPVNFNSPYKAVNIMDFWKRWHITLTDFFTRYIYIPLGGSRKGEARTYVNILIVFLISGIWHGTGWTFVVWGMMHGIMNVITRAVKTHCGAKVSASASKDASATGAASASIRGGGATTSRRGFGAAALHVAAVVGNFLYVTAAWVFFRAETVQDAIALFGRMIFGGVRPFYSTFADGFRLNELWYFIKVTPIVNFSFAWDICLWLFLIFAVVVIFFCRNSLEYIKKCKIGVFTTILTALLLIWCIVSFGGVATYLYMNF